MAPENGALFGSNGMDHIVIFTPSPRLFHFRKCLKASFAIASRKYKLHTTLKRQKKSEGMIFFHTKKVNGVCYTRYAMSSEIFS